MVHVIRRVDDASANHHCVVTVSDCWGVACVAHMIIMDIISVGVTVILIVIQYYCATH